MEKGQSKGGTEQNRGKVVRREGKNGEHLQILF